MNLCFPNVVTNVHSFILNTFAVNRFLFDDLTCLFGLWCRHSPVLSCHFKWFIWFNSQLTCDTYYIFFLLSNTRPEITGVKFKLHSWIVGFTPHSVCFLCMLSVMLYVGIPLIAGKICHAQFYGIQFVELYSA